MIKRHLTLAALVIALVIATLTPVMATDRQTMIQPLALSQSKIQGSADFNPTMQHGRRKRARYSRANYYEQRRRRNRLGSKTRTALTIGAPAAIGAGIGGLAGGWKGAGAGALIGGGSGALFRLIKR